MYFIVGVKTLNGNRFYRMTPNEFEAFGDNFKNQGGSFFYIKKTWGVYGS